MPDAELTVQVFTRILAAGAGRAWATLLDLDAAAGVCPKDHPPAGAGACTQEQLF
jgi:hypothetical protein